MPAPPGKSPGFSVLILTFNADRDLPLCLASVTGCDDVVVLDAGSTDHTVTIARAAGARVFTRPFDTLAGQRNYAQQHIDFRHPWVFHLAADERMTPELRFECEGATWEEGIDGFQVASMVYWDETWLRHSAGFRHGEVRFVRGPGFEFIPAGHRAHPAPAMRLGHLHTTLLHDPSRGGEDEWLAKHRGHAQADARQPDSSSSSDRLNFPGGGCVRFLQRYFLQRGFLDGLAGLRYCALLAQYERFKREERRRARASVR